MDSISIRTHVGYSLHLIIREGNVSNDCCGPSPSMKISCALVREMIA